MKTLINLLLIMAIVALATPGVIAQDDGPVYLTITTSHWNWDNEEGNPERWQELEQMWFDNVTMKNEHIIGSGVYHHYYSEDNSEVIFVTAYPSWSAIEDAGKRNNELAKAAWDEEEGEALGKERNSYYSSQHEDEIVISWPNAKPLTSVPDEELVYLIVTRHLAFPEDGDNDEHMATLKEFHENVTHKNPHLVAFYNHRHAWGSDGREVSNAFVVKSLADITAMQEAQGDLIDAHWPDEEERKAFFKKMNKYYTPFHSDRIYRLQPELMKITAPPAAEDTDADGGEE